MRPLPDIIVRLPINNSGPFSSDVIFKEMRKANLSRLKIKKKIDQQAAAYILQGYLEKHRNK